MAASHSDTVQACSDGARREHRSRLLWDGTGLNARLSYYPPHSRMAAHRHPFHQVSVLLCGGLQESSRHRDAQVDCPTLGFKPAQWPHANAYGTHGALILSLNLDPEDEWTTALEALPAWQWQPEGDAASVAIGQRLLRQVGRGTPAESASIEVESLVAELLARLPPTRPHRPPRQRPAAWLERVRQRVLEAPHDALTTLARGEGVHPVHLSRRFSQQFGCSLSTYRSRARFAQALPPLMEGEPIAEAAASAGFADQAHLTRSARRECGLTPGQLTALLATPRC